MNEKEIQYVQEKENKAILRVIEENFGLGVIGRCRRFIWNMTEFSESSYAAKVQIKTFIALMYVYSPFKCPRIRKAIKL